MSALEGIKKGIEACRTYNFGMRHADKLAHEDADKLVAALEAVEAQHPREVLDVHEGYGAETWCPSCRVHYPCPTLTAITEALA